MRFYVPKFFRSWGNKRAKHAAFTFPPNWPSHLHSKCTNPTCHHPNAPQAVAGKYNCLGSFAGLSCSGTYQVTPSMAKSMVRSYSFKFTLHAGEGQSKPLRTVKSRRRRFGPPDESSKIDVASSTQDASKLDDLCKNKQLPPIPGLHLRKVQRNRALSPYPPIEDSEPTSTPWHAQTHRQRLYPRAVQQSSSGVKSRSHTRNSVISWPRSLVPVPTPPTSSSATVHKQRRNAHPKF